MKIKFNAFAWSNPKYRRQGEVEVDMPQETWDEISEPERKRYLNELAIDFVLEDIDFEATVV